MLHVDDSSFVVNGAMISSGVNESSSVAREGSRDDVTLLIDVRSTTRARLAAVLVSSLGDHRRLTPAFARRPLDVDI